VRVAALYTRLGAPTVVTDSASSRSEHQWFGYPATHRRVYLLRSVMSAATLAIYVLLPRTLVTQTTSRVFVW
jgi:hypothetical protein